MPFFRWRYAWATPPDIKMLFYLMSSLSFLPVFAISQRRTWNVIITIVFENSLDGLVKPPRQLKECRTIGWSLILKISANGWLLCRAHRFDKEQHQFWCRQWKGRLAGKARATGGDMKWHVCGASPTEISHHQMYLLPNIPFDCCFGLQNRFLWPKNC